jgi:hypothetical protein
MTSTEQSAGFVGVSMSLQSTPAVETQAMVTCKIKWKSQRYLKPDKIKPYDGCMLKLEPHASLTLTRQTRAGEGGKVGSGVGGGVGAGVGGGVGA